MPPPRALSPSTVESAGFDPCRAGARPETKPVTSATRPATVSTRASMPIADTRARLSGNAAASARTHIQARASPTTSPATDTTRLSISTRCASRPRLAPSAARTAASRCCTDARASHRFATFAHAMSSTMAHGGEQHQHPRSRGAADKVIAQRADADARGLCWS